MVVDDLARSDLTGADQMRLDEAMLDLAAVEGRGPTLRLYQWRQPTLTLGRFQSDAEVDRIACEELAVEVVRRPSGGRALLHIDDVTYAIAIARPPEAVRDTYCYLAGGLVAGLRRLGITATVTTRDGGASPACLSGMAGADLSVDGRKLCGSAMVRRGEGVLLHGSILLSRGSFDETDLLVGMGEPERARLREATVTLGELGVATDPTVVAGALIEGFAGHLDGPAADRPGVGGILPAENHTICG